MADDPTTTEAPKRLHRATYARDKRNVGGYLIRVIGPTAAAFAGRTVPVTRADNTESMEKLADAVWVGTDEGMPAKDGKPAVKGTGAPVALYHFEAKPREDAKPDDLPF